MNGKLFKLAFIVLLGIVIWFIPPPAGVNLKAWHLFAIFFATIIGFILSPIPIGIITLGALTVATLTNTLTTGEALSGFSNSTIWLIVCAFLFSKGLIKSGFGRRIAYTIMGVIGHKTLNLAYSLAISDLIISPATPSVTARSGGVIFPIARSLAVAFDSEPDRNPRRIGAYLVQSVTQVCMVTSTMFLTSQAGNPLLAGLAQKTFDITIDWGTWCLAALPPGLVMLALIPYIVYKVYPPEVTETPEAKKIAQAELKKMGPVKTEEKYVCLVFVLCLLCWGTSRWTGLDATVVGILGVCILLLSGALSWDDVLTEKSAWDTLIWMGGTIAMATYLNSFGLIAWFTKTVGVYFTGLPTMATLFILLCIFMYSQYAFAGLSAHITAMFPALAALALAAGVPPLLTVISFAVVGNLCGCLTHYASGPSPIFYGSGYTDLPTWLRLGFFFSVVHMTLYMALAFAWWKIISFW